MKGSFHTIMMRELLDTANDCFEGAKAIAPSMRMKLAMRARQRSFMVISICVSMYGILGSCIWVIDLWPDSGSFDLGFV